MLLGGSWNRKLKVTGDQTDQKHAGYRADIDVPDLDFTDNAPRAYYEENINDRMGLDKVQICTFHRTDMLVIFRFNTELPVFGASI